MSTRENIKSARFTDDELGILQQRADESCNGNISEYMRRKALDDPSDNAMHHIVMAKEYGKSNLAHLNVIIDFMAASDEKRMVLFQRLSDHRSRQELLNQYKVALTRIENGEA